MTSGFASRAVARALAIAIGLAGPTFPVYAQQSSDAVDNSTPSPQAAQSKRQELPTVTPQHLFGDWGGVRTYLGDYGINLNLDFTTETAGNPTGGLRQGVDYAHQIGLQLDMDWQKLAGITAPDNGSSPSTSDASAAKP